MELGKKNLANNLKIFASRQSLPLQSTEVDAQDKTVGSTVSFVGPQVDQM